MGKSLGAERFLSMRCLRCWSSQSGMTISACPQGKIQRTDKPQSPANRPQLNSFSAAVNMFAKITLREGRIPFELIGDPFWSDKNQARLRISMEHAKEGKLTKHEIPEVD